MTDGDLPHGRGRTRYTEAFEPPRSWIVRIVRHDETDCCVNPCPDEICWLSEIIQPDTGDDCDELHYRTCVFHGDALCFWQRSEAEKYADAIASDDFITTSVAASWRQPDC